MFRGLKSIIAGILAGTALGVLFAPKKGEELRDNIKSELEEGGTGLKTVKDTVVKMGKEIGDSAQEAFKDIQDTEGYKKAKEKAHDLMGEVENRIPVETKRKVKKTVKKAKKGLKKAEKSVKKATKKAKKTIKNIKK